MVERNPGMVRSAAWDRRKYISRGEGIGWIGWREPIDQRAMCDKNVARGEPGGDGLQWSDSHVHFFAPGSGRDRRQKRGNPLAVDAFDVSEVDASGAAVVGREQISLRSGHAYGPGLELGVTVKAKESCTAVNDSCQP
jgi:hypothetical protein